MDSQTSGILVKATGTVRDTPKKENGPMIRPTPGRFVWFTPSTAPYSEVNLTHIDPTAPLAAIVTHVWGDRMVNLAVFDSDGRLHPVVDVPLLQGADPEPEGGFYCRWMPYQLAQAAKHAVGIVNDPDDIQAKLGQKAV